MSAWIVSKEHIDVLVRYALRGTGRENMRWWQVDEEGSYAGWRELDEFAEQREDSEDISYYTPSQLGQILVSENVASVHARYPDDDVDAGELPGPCDAYYMGPYVYSDPGYTLTPGEVFKAIDCLDYQSCEHEGWRTSEAFAFLTVLREDACGRVNGYQTSPWGWDASDLEKRPRDFSVRVL